MVTFATVRRLALALPETEEGTSYGAPSFKVRGKLFARLREEGVLVVKTEEGLRDVLIQRHPRTLFVTPHYQGYPYVLVRLVAIDEPALFDLLADAWALVAPKRLAARLAADAPVGRPLVDANHDGVPEP